MPKTCRNCGLLAYTYEVGEAYHEDGRADITRVTCDFCGFEELDCPLFSSRDDFSAVGTAGEPRETNGGVIDLRRFFLPKTPTTPAVAAASVVHEVSLSAIE